MIEFPEYSGLRCLMMPYIQGDPTSVPAEYQAYSNIISSVYIQKGDIGFLTIDESHVAAGTPQRGARARHGRALHTEAGRMPGSNHGCWGFYWGGKPNVRLDPDVQVMLASNLGGTTALWDATHEDTTLDGDLSHLAAQYPYAEAKVLDAGELATIGIFTPHESLPVAKATRRQFLRIISSGVHGREEYFTTNPMIGRAMKEALDG